MSEATKRSWMCRWVEWAREAHPEWEQGVVHSGSKLWQRWVERHEARCPHCRAEREGWNRVLAALRSSSPDAAPAHLLDEVMARIGRERATGAPGHEGEAPASGHEAENSWAPRSGGWDLGQVASWAAGAVALGWAASVRWPGWAAWSSARWELWEFVERWTFAARWEWSAFSQAFEAIPSGFQPYLSAGVWCVVGLSAAMVSTALAAKLSAR